jgi:FemAB-related protein (PEP-CTERM system-associated)
MFILRILNPKFEDAWDRFVESHPNGTFFHRAAWARVIEKAFGHQPLHYFTEQDGQITGVMPLVWLKTRLFGNTMISMPFCVYGGPLAVDEKTTAKLYEYAHVLMTESGTSALELRFRDPPPAQEDWVPGPDLYVTFRKAIEADHERNMKAIPRKQRAMVRKGIHNGLTSVADRDSDRLHAIYAESVRNLGTPVFHRNYFRILMEVFGNDVDITTVLNQDTPVASVMNFYFRDEVLPYYGGGTTAARGVAANDFMYWEVMRRAADRGSRMFDFGRSKLGTGSFSFKHNWGFQEEKLNYMFRLKPGQAIPEINPTNPKYALFIKAWKKLPLPVANAIGPYIVRGIG